MVTVIKYCVPQYFPIIPPPCRAEITNNTLKKSTGILRHDQHSQNDRPKKSNGHCGTLRIDINSDRLHDIQQKRVYEYDAVDALGRSKDTSAFGADKIFGIVSITSEVYITQVDADSSLSGALSALSSDKGFLKDSQQMLDKSVPTVLNSMSNTNNYLLLPQKNVTGNNAYANTKASGNSVFSKKNIARGYKRISDKKNMASLARDLNIDAAVHVNISYGYSIDGTNYNGLVQVGKNYATVKVDLMAVNQNGKVIWEESDATIAKHPVSSDSQVGDAANFKKLEPHLLQSLKATLGKIMGELNT